MFKENRRQPRETVALPVAIGDGASGETRDISATGLFFVTDGEAGVGSEIEVEIELDLPSGPVKLQARGQVVRIEPQGRQTGVAVRLKESRLVPVD